MKALLEFGHLNLSRKRFEIAHGVRTEADVFIVMAEAEGIAGWGSGTPSSLFSDSPEKCREVLSEFCQDTVGFEEYFDENPLSELRRRSPSATAAIDIAMYDLRGKLEGKNLSELLGGNPSDLEISATIDLACGESAGSEAERLMQSGFRIIKVKVGKSLAEDIQRIFAVREGAGPNARIIADANCGYSFDDAVRFLDETVGARLEMLEQPVGAESLKKMADLRNISDDILICADESVLDENDLESVIEAEIADVVNIKLMKCGGIGFALKMNAIAKEAGVETMIGSMGDIGLSIGAVAHMASSLGMIYADLDSHLNIETVCDGPIVKNGLLQVPSIPGVGVSLLQPWHDLVRRQFTRSFPSKNG